MAVGVRTAVSPHPAMPRLLLACCGATAATLLATSALVHAEHLAGGCLHNLTQPNFVLDPSTCPLAPLSPGCLPGGSSESLAAQGAGWLEGGFTSVAYVNQAQADLELKLNSTGLPPLAVVVSFVGDVSKQLQKFTMRLANQDEPTLRQIDVAGLQGEFVALIAPDAASQTRGWCGSFMRWLRVRTEPVASIPPPMKPLLLPPGKPMLLFDDFWLQSRQGTSRRVMPAKQMRLSNSSWPPQFVTPGSAVRQRIGAGAWVVPIEDPPGSGIAPLHFSHDNRSVSFEAALNHEFGTPPASDPNSTRLVCSGDITEAFTSDAEIEQFTCRPKASATGHGGDDSSNPSLRFAPAATESVVATTTVATVAAVAPPSTNAASGAERPWPPAQLPPRWSWAETIVRWYDPALDGPVDVQSLGVFFNDMGSPHWEPIPVLGGPSLGLAAAYPYWQRLGPTTGKKETIILTVDGKREPLLHGPEFGDLHAGTNCTLDVCADMCCRYNATVRRGPCHRLDYGRLSGPMYTDPVCMGVRLP